MTSPILILGPSFGTGAADAAAVENYTRWLDDEGALTVFYGWATNCKGKIPVDADMDLSQFLTQKDNLYLEEYHPENGNLAMRYMGEFIKTLYTANEDGSYYSTWDDIDAVVAWAEVDNAMHMNKRPTVNYYYMTGDDGIAYFGESTLPVTGSKGEFLSIGCIWEISKEAYDHIQREFDKATDVSPLVI